MDLCVRLAFKSLVNVYVCCMVLQQFCLLVWIVKCVHGFKLWRKVRLTTRLIRCLRTSTENGSNQVIGHVIFEHLYFFFIEMANLLLECKDMSDATVDGIVHAS